MIDLDPEVLKLIEHFANIEIFEDSQYSKPNYKECKCVICKKQTSSNYYTVHNKIYCPTCYEKYIVERCHKCNKKLGTYYTVDNKKYCVDCYFRHKAPKCCICNKPITGCRYTFPIGECCESCYEQNPLCHHCGSPADKSSPYIYRDEDFILCQKCNKDKITNKDVLKPLHYKMKFCAKEAFGKDFYIPIKKVMLISSAELKAQIFDDSYGKIRALGYCEQTKNSIYLQNGMPYDMMFKTLAHEYGHAWEYHKKRADLRYKNDNLSFCEGFAQWVAYHILREYNLKEQAEKLKIGHTDRIYGDGFKEMLKLEKKLGSKKAVLEYVKNNTDF